MPKAKKPDLDAPPFVPFKFTSVYLPIGVINGKNMAGNFSRSDSQLWTSRRKTDEDWEVERAGKRSRLIDIGLEDLTNVDSPTKSVNKIDGADEAIDPASRMLVVHPGSRFLRIGRASDEEPSIIPNVIARRYPSHYNKPVHPPPTKLDPTLDQKIEALRLDHKARMRLYKLRPQANGTGLAAAYNEFVKPEMVPEAGDDFTVSWTNTKDTPEKAFFVGEEAINISDPIGEGWLLRWPIKRGQFNTSYYSCPAELLGDVQEIWMYAIRQVLGINLQELKDFTVILIVPDLFDHTYIREMCTMMIQGMGFKQMCLQQESICATYGAGLSTACIVDIGACKTSISCIEEGIILPETRTCLSIGGDDITEFLYQLLLRAKFPYAEADLNRNYDWLLMETLKENVCVLSEADVGLNLFHFDVRLPHQPARKYTLRLFDEVILAPMCLFAPRIIDFNSKLLPGPRIFYDSNEVDEVLDIGANAITTCMRLCTRHLLQMPPPTEVATLATASSPQPPIADNELSIPAIAETPASATPMDATSPVPSVANGFANADVLPGNVEGPQASQMINVPTAPIPTAKALAAAEADFDIVLEASKIPLDVAIFESVSAVVTEERMRRVMNGLVIVGGTANIHNTGFAVQSRLVGLFAARYPSVVDQINVVPPPRNIDPSMLAWKGATMLSKIDSANEFMIRGSDWDVLGLRTLRDRSFFFVPM